MLLDTLPFASGSPKSMMSGQVPALERLGRDDANLRQAWTTQQDTPSKNGAQIVCFVFVGPV